MVNGDGILRPRRRRAEQSSKPLGLVALCGDELIPVSVGINDGQHSALLDEGSGLVSGDANLRARGDVGDVHYAATSSVISVRWLDRRPTISPVSSSWM